MKRLYCILITIMAVGIMGCDHNPKIITPQGETSVLCSDAEEFALNPIDKPLDPVKEKQALLGGCDMAIFDEGKVTFYNSSTNTIIPFVAEDDYVVTGVFVDNSFYYTVAIGDELYLKRIYAADYLNYPELLTDWDLKLSDCVNDECEKVASMVGYPGFQEIGILHGVDPENCNFKDYRFYDIYAQTQWDGWGDDGMLGKHLENEDLFNEIALGLEEKGISAVLLEMNPSHQYIAFGDIKDWMDQDIVNIPGHGPLCFSSLDGKMQVALEEIDVANMYNWGWLTDDTFVFSDREGIKTVSLDGTIKELSPGRWFVTGY